MAGDAQLVVPQVEPAPLDYTVPGAAVIRVKSVRAEFVDDGAVADWLPAVQLISNSGHIMATASDQGSKVTAGGDADASFFPGVKHAAAAAAATASASAAADNSGVGPQSVPSNNSGIYMDFAGGAFSTSDPATYSIVVDSGFYGVSSLSVHKVGTHLCTLGVSGVGFGGAGGWTAALAAATFLEVEAYESSPNLAINYVYNSPDGGYGFSPPLPAGGFWWSAKTQFTMSVSADMGTHPVVARVIQNGGNPLFAYCSLLVEKISDTVF